VINLQLRRDGQGFFEETNFSGQGVGKDRLWFWGSQRRYLGRRGMRQKIPARKKIRRYYSGGGREGKIADESKRRTGKGVLEEQGSSTGLEK